MLLIPADQGQETESCTVAQVDRPQAVDRSTCPSRSTLHGATFPGLKGVALRHLPLLRMQKGAPRQTLLSLAPVLQPVFPVFLPSGPCLILLTVNPGVGDECPLSPCVSRLKSCLIKVKMAEVSSATSAGIGESAASQVARVQQWQVNKAPCCHLLPQLLAQCLVGAR